MNKIYSQAAWCLVTASASSANDPLPRIGNEQDNLRSPYASRTVQGLQLATKPPPLYELISSSRWGSRAWTYQENVLSQRRLYVTNAQAYFTCRHDSMFSEARGSEHSQRLSEVTYFNKGHVYGKQNVTNFEVYSKAVEEYTTRDMALQEDALKALTGVLSYLQTSFRGSFLYGLPDTEIDQALLWRPRDNAIRRKDRTGRYLFPSWSWAGWIGSVEFEQNLAISRVKWKNPHTGKFFSTESFRRPDSDSIDSCWYRDTWSEEDIHGSIYVSSGGFDENGKMGEMRYLHPVADCASTKDWMFFDIKQRLQFRALFCCFKINRQHDRYASCSRGMHNVCALKIFSFSDNQVGTIHVPGSIAALLQPGAFEFVRLSRTRLNEDDTSHNQFPADYDEFGGLAIPQAHSGQKFEPDYHPNLFQFDTEKFDHTVPWCVYNVMLIETKDGISQRLGIGKVHMDAFLQESPVWKEFILE
ncbi:hypothetical protein P153DRAFT_21496 [Dothidotthia symphoricarpi CBS 119687]|uniref:Heterokaryon incompatibility domain-containing protein n=1 Tax=Dothidotthia symphoricarpi CBS 119687 TaxID=1392245 RepID=A0A6A6AE38_9PLEO|nr:uncharacterized protein P153DRAFT_21496 [Dothidotthia symphoricarpi CBS 119687]KAF2129553.1 hypothetical protein P153DRAFT_21496 [Dothidotthia symphoricarpi CBS 119687]